MAPVLSLFFASDLISTARSCIPTTLVRNGPMVRLERAADSLVVQLGLSQLGY